MTRILLLGPYGDDQPFKTRYEHVLKAEEVARNLMAQGHSVMCPFLMTHYWGPDPRLTREMFLTLSMSFLENWAEAVARLPGESPGTDAEIARAYELGLEVTGAIG